MKLIINSILALSFVLGAGSAYAQMMDSPLVENDHTAQEEAEGKIVWEKLQSKQIACADLSDDDFGVLGEYFMGQMLGDSHSSMNAMMTSMIGEEGEEQMHVAMGKRLSNCDPLAAYPASGTGFMPMMNMMGGWSTPFSTNEDFNMGNYNYYPMMGWDGGGIFGGVFMLFWWILLIVGIVALVKWVMNQSSERREGKSPLEILKERYAKGEIDKKDFEEKKKDL